MKLTSYFFLLQNGHSKHWKIGFCIMCSFLVVDFTDCDVDSQTKLWTFSIGFPSTVHLQTIGPLITESNVLPYSSRMVACKKATCAVNLHQMQQSNCKSLYRVV